MERVSAMNINDTKTITCTQGCHDTHDNWYKYISYGMLWWVQNAAALIINGDEYSKHVTPLLPELHWLQVCFQVQFKVPVITFKALFGLGSGYLRDCLLLVIFTRQIQSNMSGMLWVLSAKEHWLAGTRRWVFSAVTPTLWNIVPSEIRMTLTLLVLHNGMKIRLCG